jgi:predicted RNA binding protein YcfA (HicA-like mRNA interferase family)
MKVRTLKSLLRRGGFCCRAGKGSHSIWTYPARPDLRLVLAGNDGDDAKPYQLTRARKRQTQVMQTPGSLETNM